MATTALIAPTVPKAEYDGLITLANLKDDIDVRLQLWEYSHEADTYQLLLNGLSIGLPQQLPTPLPPTGTELTLKLEKRALQDEGVYEVAYRATNVLGDTFSDSASTRIRVDRTSPGAALLAPIIFPDTSFGDRLTGLLPGYAGMEAGDTIQTLCNGLPGPVHIVQPDELTLRPVEIVFDREVLKSLASDCVDISYTVIDRAGNESIPAVPIVLSLAL